MLWLTETPFPEIPSVIVTPLATKPSSASGASISTARKRALGKTPAPRVYQNVFPYCDFRSVRAHQEIKWTSDHGIITQDIFTRDLTTTKHELVQVRPDGGVLPKTVDGHNFPGYRMVETEDFGPTGETVTSKTGYALTRDEMTSFLRTARQSPAMGGIGPECVDRTRIAPRVSLEELRR